VFSGDLKPENVLLKMDTTSPIGVVAKITDFGEHEGEGLTRLVGSCLAWPTFS
jgi:serine/threonine protein kinase